MPFPGLVADQLHLVFEQHRCSFAPCPPHLILEMGVKHMEELLTRLVQRKPRNHSIVKAFFTHLFWIMPPPLDLKDTQLLLAQQVQQPAIDLRNPKLTPEVFLDLAWSLMTGRANHRRITIAHGRPRRTAYASPFAEWPVPYSSSVEASPGHWTGGVDTPASDCRRAQTHQEKRHPDWFEFISLPPSSLEGPPHLSIYSILP